MQSALVSQSTPSMICPGMERIPLSQVFLEGRILMTCPVIFSTMKNTALSRLSLGLAAHPSHAGTLMPRRTLVITSPAADAGQ